MPEIQSSYKCPRSFKNGHVHTVCARFLRPSPKIRGRRERIETPDNDFFDVDWYETGKSHITLVLHGLEGTGSSLYMRCMVASLMPTQDVCAMNFRGCSGEPNRHLAPYHSGKWDDLLLLINRVSSLNRWKSLSVIGFSVGGNIALKMLGELGSNVPSILRNALVISPPCDLTSTSMKLALLRNSVYMQYFLTSLEKKIKEKNLKHSMKIDHSGFRSIRTFEQYDNRYTAPWFGYESAREYWADASSLPVLPGIRVPTLILSASDDPFLTEECFPHRIVKENSHLYLERTKHGGHVGFLQGIRGVETWAEKRAGSLIKNFPE